MKKYLFVAIFALCALGVNAQEYKPFQFYLGLGYAMPTDGGGGILVDLEPAYRINDAIAVGLRVEAAVTAKVAGETESSASAFASYTLNGKYYFSNNNFRPYAGVGFGIYTLGSSDYSVAGGSNNVSVDAGTAVGFYPRVGFDAGHFNFNIDFNIIGKTQIDDFGIGNVDPIKNSYIGFRIGGFFGGGRN